MNILEKKEYIHSHLHLVDDNAIDEVFLKIYSLVENKNSIVGYEPSGTPITKAQLIKDLREAEDQIERGEYLTIEELEKESEDW